MPSLFDQYEAENAGQPTPTGGRSLFEQYEAETSPLPTKPPPDPKPVLVGEKQKAERGKIFSGGIVHDAFDLLSVPQYAAAGLAKGIQAGKNPFTAIGEGVQNRASFEDVLAAGGMEEGLPRTLLGIGLDVALDPTWILTPALAAKQLGKIGAVRKAAEAAEEAFKGSKVGRALGKTFVYGFDTPNDVLRLTRETRREIAIVERRGGQLMQDIRKLGEDAKEPLAGFLEHTDEGVRHAYRQAAIESGVDAAKFDAITKTAEQIDDDLIKILVREGVVGPNQINSIVGRNLRQAYQSQSEVARHIAKLRATGDPGDAQYADDLQIIYDKFAANARKPYAHRIRLQNARDDIPEEMAKKLSEVTDVGYRVARNVQMGARAGHEAKLLNFVASHYAVDAAEGVQRGYKVLPETSKLGNLSGKYVPEGIHDFIQSTIDMDSKIPKWWRKAVGYWKAGKVIFSPASQARNMMSNPLLLNLAGVPMHELPLRYAEAVKVLRAVDNPARLERYLADAGLEGQQIAKLAEFIKAGGGSNMMSEEVSKILADMDVGGNSLLSKLTAPFKTGMNKASEIYGVNEIVSKIAAGIHAIRKGGVDFHTAVDFGEKAVFDYAAVPKIVKAMRESGVVPFASFSYFASDATARALWSRPAAVGKFGKAFRGIEAMNPDAQQERAVAPEWMKEFGQIFTPIKDKYGRHLVFDASYMLPWADIANTAERGGLNKAMSMTPFITFMQDLARNQSSFTGRPISKAANLSGNAGAMKNQVTKDYVDYIYKFMMPTWMPSILPGYPEKMQLTSGGYAFRDIEQAVKARPDVFGRNPQSKTAAVMGAVFGLKTRPFTMSAELRFRAKEYKENVQAVQQQMRHVAMDQELSAEQKQQLFSKLRDDLINIHRAFRMGSDE